MASGLAWGTTSCANKNTGTMAAAQTPFEDVNEDVKDEGSASWFLQRWRDPSAPTATALSDVDLSPPPPSTPGCSEDDDWARAGAAKRARATN